MKRIFLLTVLFFAACIAHAQNPMWTKVGISTRLSANSIINKILTDKQGNVYAAGSFSNDSTKRYVAIWNGYNWTELGSLPNRLNANFSIYDIAMNGAGMLYAAGSFTNATGNGYVAQWNGNNWIELGTGTNALKANQTIYTITTDKQGYVYAAGAFKNAGNKKYVAKWNGTKWSELGTGTNALNANGSINAVVADSLGNVYAAGYFTNGSSQYYVAKWNGTNWSELGTGANALNANNSINCLQLDKVGNIYAAGVFTNGSSKKYVAKWNGTNWAEVGTGANSLNASSDINSISIDIANNIYAGGYFINGSSKKYVAKWNGTSWAEIGTGTNSLQANSQIQSVCMSSKGELYTAGDFENTINKRYVAHWNGTKWDELGIDNRLSTGFIGINRNVVNLVTDKHNNIFTVGYINGQCIIAKWDGRSWSEVGAVGHHLNANGGIGSILIDSANNIYCAGYFTNTSGKYYVAKWDGINWSELGTGSNALNANSYILSLTIDRLGNIYAAGDFRNSSNKFYVAQWNGTSWSELGTGIDTLKANNQISSIASDKYGNIYATGNFKDSAFAPVVKWNGIKWSVLGGKAGLLSQDNQALLIDDSGYVFVSFEDAIYAHTFKVSKFNGTSWMEVRSPLSSFPGTNPIEAIIKGKDDKLYIGGEYYNSNNPTNYLFPMGIYSWDGLYWTKVGKPVADLDMTGFVFSLSKDSIGNIYASGTFIDGDFYSYVVKYSGHNYFVNLCPGGSYMVGSKTITQAGIYDDTLTASNGKDSILTYIISTNLPSVSMQYVSACSNAPLVFNGDTLKSSGTYYDTLINYRGCDSVIMLHYTYNITTQHSFAASTCQGTPYSFFGNNLTTAGTYTHHLTNHNGCDSLITLTLTIKPTSSSTQLQTICQGSSYNFYGTNLNATGAYTHHFTNYVGCDSLITLTLTVTPINLTVNQSGSTLTAASSSNYQWIDCSNNASINGATNQSFIVTASGDYAVVVTQNNCTDTSACTNVIISGINTIKQEQNSLIVYPNPAGNQLTVGSNQFLVNTIEVTNVLGQSVLAVIPPLQRGQGGLLLINIETLSKGIYFLKATDSTGNRMNSKFIKQ